ncbi:hypothetical protein OG426_09295 [Streptomyces canus]|nr:hypothetical protein OG426_09295 [Streptomyces canus]
MQSLCIWPQLLGHNRRVLALDRIPEGDVCLTVNATRMGHEVAGVEGLYSHATPTMEQEIADSLQTRWLRFVAGEGEHWKVPSPTTLAFDLEEWWKTAGQSRPGHLRLNSFMKFISTKSFMPFVWYRIVLGIVIIVLVSMGALSPHAGESGG